MRAGNPTKLNQYVVWTKEEDEALTRGRLKYGDDWEKIHETEKEVLGRRTVAALQCRISNLKSGKTRKKHNTL